jgi:diguanylate cyclase (GGDEF)-like protein/PAS domain S-box-containing protein
MVVMQKQEDTLAQDKDFERGDYESGMVLRRMLVVTINSLLLWILIASPAYPYANSWVIGAVAAGIFRYVFTIFLLNQQTAKWVVVGWLREVLSLCNVFIGGAVWGVASFVFFDLENSINNSILSLVVVGMAAAGAYTYAMKDSYLILFLVSNLSPLVYMIFISLTEHQAEFIALTVMYGIGMYQSAKGNQLLADKSLLEQKKAEKVAAEALQLAARLQLMVDRMPLGLVQWNEEREISVWNPAAKGIFGFGLDQVERNFRVFQQGKKDISEPVATKISDLFEYGEPFSGLDHNINEQGEDLICLWRHEPVVDESKNVIEIISFVEDVTERVKANEIAEHRAYNDMLTGLPNRQSFHMALTGLRAGLEFEGMYCAALLIDMDNFKTINDTRGHDYGDQVLIAFGQRLDKKLACKHRVARLGGDEFIILMEGIDSDKSIAKEKATILVDEIIQDSNNYYDIFDEQMYVELSIGVTIFDKNMEDGEILKAADLALYEVKESGRNGYRFYEEEMSIKMQQEMLLLHDLKDAARNDSFEPFFQPIFHTASDKVSGAEVLMRWRKSDGEIVAADKFINVLEESLLIGKVSCMLIRKVCCTVAQWVEQGLWQDDWIVYFNLCALDLKHDDFTTAFLDSCNDYGLSPSLFDFELTERELFQHVDRFSDKMMRLKDAGAKLTIDDFGTGYASLGYIKNLPVDALKIDQMFIADMGTNKDDYLLVKAILSICDALELNCIAEGVENAGQLSMLKQLGCDKYQGYYPCVPLEEKEFEIWCKDRK